MTNRIRALILTALFLLGLGFGLTQQASARTVDSAPAFDAVDLLNEVNAFRAKNDLPPFQMNPLLMGIAQTQADHMAKNGVLSHFDASGRRPYQRAVDAGYPVGGDLSQGGLFAENVYSGASSLAAADVVAEWSRDAVHLALLLSTDLQDAGTGFATVTGTAYYVLDAGSAVAKEDPAATPKPTITPTFLPGLVVTNTPHADGAIYHVVQKEEALWNIALSYNMSVDDLKKLNRLTTNDIYEGQKLLIFKPKPGPTITPTVGVTPTATFGIPTSTPTEPVTPTATATFTPLPTAPASMQNSGRIIGGIVLVALLGAGVGAWLGSRKKE